MPKTQPAPSNRAERRHPEVASESQGGLLDYEGSAPALGCSPRMVRKLVETRQLASIKVGSLVRIHPDDIADYINRQRRAAS